MELTYEEAEKMLWDRIRENPDVEKFISSPDFKRSLAQILEFEGIDVELLPLIENQVMLVLALFVPYSEFAEGVQENTGLPPEKVSRLATMVDAFIFLPFRDELLAFDHLYKEERANEERLPEGKADAREKLELRPEGVSGVSSANEDGPRPLTREEVLRAIAPTRTMQKDIASIKDQPDTPSSPVRGYEAYEKEKGRGS